MHIHASRRRKPVPSRVAASYGAAELSRRLSRHILDNQVTPRLIVYDCAGGLAGLSLHYCTYLSWQRLKL